MKPSTVHKKLFLIGKGIVSVGLLASLFFSASCTSATKAVTQNTTPAEIAAAQQAALQQERVELSREMTIAYNLGNDLYNQKSFEDALPYFWKTHEIDKGLNSDKIRYPGVFLKIANSYLERGLEDSTFYAYTEGLKYDPENLNYLKWIQWYHAKTQSLDNLIDVTEEILGKMQANDESLSSQVPYIKNVKDLYLNRGEYEKALEKIELLITLLPGDKESLDLERINMIREIGGDAALQKEFEKQHDENPNDSDIIWNLLKFYEDQGLTDKVLEFVDKYIALKPEDIDARLIKIDALKEKNRIDDAIAELDNISKMRPADPQYIVAIAEMYFLEKDDLRRAMTWAQKARGVNANYGPANLMIANIIVEVIDNAMERKGISAPDYDDKLVGEIAVSYFVDASKDPNTKSEADTRGNFYRENYTRTDADKFMKKGVERPENTPEYDWIWRYKK